MTLHIVSRSSFDSQALNSCIRMVQEEDALLLIDDGLFCLLDPKTISLPCPLYYLVHDAALRNLEPPEHAQAIDYDQMVSLTAEHNPIQTWS